MSTEELLQRKNKDELLTLINSYQEKLADKTQEITTYQEKIKHQNKTIHYLLEQLKINRYRQYGKKSEQCSGEDAPEQFNLFDEAALPENKDDIEQADESITIASHTRIKKVGRKALPKDLPREQHIYDLSDAEKICACGCQLTHIGNDTSEQLNIIPAKMIVIEHIRKKYACQSCEETIKTAKLLPQPIPKSIAAPGLLAHVLTAKYQDHLPLYRQEKIFQRLGIDIPRATLSHWVLKCADLLLPLYKLMQANIIAYDIAYADESTLQVLKAPDKPPGSKSYMWLFSGGPPDTFCYTYQYAPSRSHDVPLTFFEDYTGFIHCDGYGGYDVLARKHENITQVGCWYHARRKFVEAGKVSKTSGLSAWFVRQIALLSQIEKKAKEENYNAEKIYKLRQEKALPILDKIKTKLDKKKRCVVEQSLLGKAISYTLNQWPKLLRYCQDGRLDISNNRTERAIKPFATGRKNWLFAGSVDGANAAAIIYSFVETCKEHKVQPYDWFADTFQKIPTAETVEQLEQLLPYNFPRKQ